MSAPLHVQPEAYAELVRTAVMTLPNECVGALLGREVAVLASGARGPGAYTARWDGSALPSGVYFSRLTVGLEAHPSFAATRKLILLK